MSDTPRPDPTPLVVDLDGTLVQTDLLVESALGFMRHSIWRLWQLPVWLADGKARLKKELARRTPLDATTLPYNAELLDYLRAQKALGRTLVLATASDDSYARAVADHLGIFDQVFATRQGHNLSAGAKRDALVAAFGHGGFDYAGNAMDDLPVWAACRRGLAVRPARGVIERARALPQVTLWGTPTGTQGLLWLRALRMHQWMKNLLIFVPLLASHQFSQPGQLWRGVVAFVVFGLCASSVYLLNDLLDLPDDRRHASKRQRPFAAGTLPVLTGLLAAPLLLVMAFALGLWLLPPWFSVCLAMYFALTLAYSLALKQLAIVDVVVLALLYTQRIIAGTLAFQVAPTFWLLAFSLFIFFSLALLKRYAELHEARASLQLGRTPGRGYTPDDLEMIASLGAASGYISVLVIAFYVQDQATRAMYRHPEVIWLVCPLLLFWISRAWLLTHRGQMHDDPVVFAIKDRVSLAVGACFALVFWLAI